jgi:SAM-dependent methyltransferase
VDRSFDVLVTAAESAPIKGWDFSWLEGRASEERPSWHYSELVADRIASAARMLDIQAGGGEMLVNLPAFPPLMVATEGWEPNVVVAAKRLQPRGGHVVVVRDDRPALPFGDSTFDLVTSRHPTVTWWGEVARVLCPRGSFLSQQVGPHSVGELTDFMMSPQAPSAVRAPETARANAEAAGLQVEDLRSETLRTVFHDIGAVVYFLRLVIWIVPGFTVERYRKRLKELHDQIEENGPFVAHATRFLIDARKPPRADSGMRRKT